MYAIFTDIQVYYQIINSIVITCLGINKTESKIDQIKLNEIKLKLIKAKSTNLAIGNLGQDHNTKIQVYENSC